MEEEVTWRGYLNEFSKRKYQIEIPKEKFEKLWKKFKEWKGSQEDFYFRFVNPYRFLEVKKIREK